MVRHLIQSVLQFPALPIIMIWYPLTLTYIILNPNLYKFSSSIPLLNPSLYLILICTNFHHLCPSEGKWAKTPSCPISLLCSTCKVRVKYSIRVMYNRKLQRFGDGSIPWKLESIFPPTLFWAITNYSIQPCNDLVKIWPNNWFWIPTFLNQPAYRSTSLRHKTFSECLGVFKIQHF